jgi:hypothetical protein
VPPNHKLGYHSGDAEHEREGYVKQDKRRTAILTCHIWETPNVSQSYGRACSGKDNADA